MLKSDVRIFVKLTDHDQFFLKTATAQKKKKKKKEKKRVKYSSTRETKARDRKVF